jgi:hypothetical protein
MELIDAKISEFEDNFADMQGQLDIVSAKLMPI